MPTTENDRRNLQQPTLEKPSMPDHDRTKDKGMHAANPEHLDNPEDLNIDADITDEGDRFAAPDQEFEQISESGPKANGGRIHEDPNNLLTSEPETSIDDQDPENRGESQPDILDGDKH